MSANEQVSGEEKPPRVILVGGTGQVKIVITRKGDEGSPTATTPPIEDVEALKLRLEHEKWQLKAELEAKAKMKADQDKRLQDGLAGAYSRAEQTFKMGHSLGWWTVVSGFLLGALVAWLLFWLYRNSTSDIARVEVAPVVDEITGDSTRVDSVNRGQGFTPEPDVNNTSTQDESQVAETEAPNTVTYGGLLIADSKLVMRVYNYITKDKMNLRLEASDKLDGEPKEQLLAAMISTLFANGQRVVFLNNELEIKDFDYTAQTSKQVQDIVSEQAHHIVSFGKFCASKTPESFNAWANIAFDELKLNAETDFSVAVSHTLDVLNAALKASGHTEFNDVKVVIDENRAARGKALIVEHTASKPRKQLAASAPPTNKKSTTTLPSPYSSWRHIGAYHSPVPPPKSKRERDVRGVKPRVGLNRPHHGHDIARASGTPIFSTSNGKVIKRGYQVNKWTKKGYGHYLDIYDGKYVWRYAHMKSRSIFGKDDTVRKGQQIGSVGDTGSTGSFHLHIECWTPVEYYKKENGDKNATPISKKLWQ